MEFFSAIAPMAFFIIGGFYILKYASGYVITLKIKKRIENLTNFTVSQSYISVDGETGIAVDTRKKKICLLKARSAYNDMVDYKIIDYKDLLSCSIIEDGASISSTQRTSQAGNALIGGALFGGVGAIVGALTSKSVTSGKVNNINLKIVINNTQSPVWLLSFVRFSVSKDSFSYQDIMKKVHHWDGLLAALIKQADAADNVTNNKPESKTLEPSLSIADEITKLAELTNKGILSEAEFKHQKNKLLKQS